MFTDRPIESAGMENLSKELRAGPNTSAVAQLAGNAGLLSPVQIDHIIGAYFGWLGTHIVATADLAMRPLMAIPQRPAYRIDDVLVIGDFAKGLPARQSRYVTELYDQGRKFQETLADLRMYQMAGATEKAQALLADKGAEIQLGILYRRAQQQLSQINARARQIQLTDMDAEEKRQALDGLNAMRHRLAVATAERSQAMQARAQ